MIGSVLFFIKISVLVEVSHKKRVLGLVKPGFALEANKQKITYELMKLEALEIPDWRNNKLVFKNTSFQEIKNTLERHYNVKLILENDKLNNCSFAGSFDNRSIDYVLSIISEVGNFKYKIDYEKKEVSIFGKGCEN